MGPLLFLIYINNLNNVLDKCKVHHFGDDTNLLFGSKCPSEISCVMNNELKLLTGWLRADKLSLNESKTKLLIFRPSRKLNITVPNIKLNNFIFTPEKYITYVGIEIYENLSWNRQIEMLANKLSRTNGILSKLRYYVFSKNYNFNLLESFSIFYSIWLYSLALCVSKKHEEGFCSPEKMDKTFNIF